MRVLVADDDHCSVDILSECLREYGYEVTVARNGLEAFDFVRTGQFQLVVSDWEMPEMNGVELCRQIRSRQWCKYIYVILLTSHSGVDSIVRGLNAGADDFISKPFNPDELRMRMRTGERVLSLEARDLTIFALAKLAESRDTDTGAHLERIRHYCRVLTSELSQWDKYRDIVDGEFSQLVFLTSPLHDIGKVGIPDKVLLKPGKLTPEEFAVMQEHTTIGAKTLEAAAAAHPEAKFLAYARDIALTHHERFDGQGYPEGRFGEEIPLCGRVVALADVYDALTTKRIYKPEFTHETAKSIILDERGKQFDPDIVEAFVRREAEFVAIHDQFPGGEAETDLSSCDVAPVVDFATAAPQPVWSL